MKFGYRSHGDHVHKAWANSEPSQRPHSLLALVKKMTEQIQQRESNRDMALALAERAEQTVQILHERVDELSNRLRTAIPATNTEVRRSFPVCSHPSRVSEIANAELSRPFGRQPSRASEASSSGSAFFSSAGSIRASKE